MALALTIEVINEREQSIGQGRFGTDTGGYKAMGAGSMPDRGRQQAQAHLVAGAVTPDHITRRKRTQLG